MLEQIEISDMYGLLSISVLIIIMGVFAFYMLVYRIHKND